MSSVDTQDGVVRVGTAADRAAIERLVNEAFAVERFMKRGGGDRLQADGREMDAFLARGSFLVLEEGGVLKACVYVEPRGERCYLGLLSVAPGEQGRGVGRKMASAAEAFARERGCSWMDLRVVSPRRKELVPIYSRLGYAESGMQEYPAELAREMVEPGHFINMTKPL